MLYKSKTIWPLATHRGRLAPQKRPKKVAICKFQLIFQKVFVFCPFLGVNALYYNENKFIGLKLEIKEQNNNLLITIGKQVDFLFL